MKIAYLISAYKDPKQFGRMLNALHEDDTYFYVHVDAKVSQRDFENAVPENVSEHVTFIKKRYWVQWGGFSQVRYQRDLLSTSLSSGIDFDRVFILTAQDYPLWSNKQIADELTKNPVREYIKGLNISELALNGGGMLKDKLTLYHFFRDMNHVPYKMKKMFSGGSRMIMKLLPIRKKAYIVIDGKRIDAYQSSSYMCITGKLAKFICEELCNNKKIMDYFRYAFVPEELVIPTIVFNSQFRAHCTVYPRKRYEGLKNLSSITYFNYGKSIQVFNLENYDELMNSNKMFARKFATGISDTLMDRLDKEHNLIK